MRVSEHSAAQEFESEYGIPVRSIAGLSDLIKVLEGMSPEGRDNNIGEVLEKILAYREEYGIAV